MAFRAGSHILTWPATETSIRIQRIGPPPPPVVAHAPAAGFVKFMVMVAAGTGATRPKPLNAMALCVPSTLTPAEPSVTDRRSIRRGAAAVVESTASESRGLAHRLTGVSKLTTQLAPVVDSAQELLRSSVIENRIVALRRTASARASCKPLSAASAALRTRVLMIHVL